MPEGIQDWTKTFSSPGAVLHDIGKLEELGNPENPSYTTRGTLIGHVVLGRDLLREAAAQIDDFPSTLLMLLEHLILNHQGLTNGALQSVPRFRKP
mgnify:CR=1 FL=1